MHAYIVAHPDDETLWFMPSPGDLVFTCTRPTRDPDRVAQFHQACDILGVHGEVGLEPDEVGGRLSNIGVNRQTVLDVNFDIITHNAVGEYGHPQHQQVHNLVMTCRPEDTMQFGYGMLGTKTRVLTDSQLERKIAALKCYTRPIRKNWPTWQACVDLYFGGRLENLRTETYFDKLLSI